MPLHFLTNFEIQKSYQNEPKFNGVYSRNNSPKIKDGWYLTNLDEYIRTLWTDKKKQSMNELIFS